MPVLDCGYIVRRLCTGRYLPAHLRRIPLMGQRAVSPILQRTTITATTSCRTEFFDMARAQRIRHIPADAHQNDLWGEMRSLKTDCHRRSPSSITVGHRGRSYCKSTQMKICDQTVTPAMATGLTDHVWTMDELLSFRVPPKHLWC